MANFTRRTFISAAVAAPLAPAQPPPSLPGTLPLILEGDLTERMMDGAHRFVERKIRESLVSRPRHWKRDPSSATAYEQSVAANRKRFLQKIGAVDPRPRARLVTLGDDSGAVLVAETTAYRIYQVRWDALDGVHGEGLRLEPLRSPVAQVVAMADAANSPEQLCGLADGLAPEAQFARTLAENGCRVLIPETIDRTSRWSGHPDIRMTDQTHREWIYRQAFHLGRHVIGYEVQKALAAVDWFRSIAPALPVGAAGAGEGGLVAFYSAAADTRIACALVAGYFRSRQNVWAEPIYRNVWGLLEEFGDAELASLIAPRALVIIHGGYPEVHNQKGDLVAPPFTEVASEFERIGALAPSEFQPRRLVAGPRGAPVEAGSPAAMREFLPLLANRPPASAPLPPPADRRRAFDPAARQQRQVRELERHVQSLVVASEHVRNRAYLFQAAPRFAETNWTTAVSTRIESPEPFIKASGPHRDRFRREVMGAFDEPYLPPSPRSRKARETERWTGYEVALDVWPELFAWGALLVPKDLRPGERRPVVVCQHGRRGRPWDTVEEDGAYNRFAATLADRGFIVFAPQNLYIFEDRYRWLSRKGNGIKASLFSFIIAQHEQILRWLGSLPFVDAARIAFYGLSYGGETAVRVPAALEGYCLSICSGDFNNWVRKVASTDEQFSFMYSIEWEMPYFDMGNTYDNAEMAYLIFPRPFMVERGHDDRVGRDRWVDYEYAKVRQLYAQMGLAGRSAIEHFNGGHAIHAMGTFDFLHRHLNWPAPGASPPA